MKEQHDARQWADQSNTLAEIFMDKTKDHWAAHFEGSEACVVAVLNPWDAKYEPHNASREIWDDTQGFLQAVPAPRFDSVTPKPRTAPERGADRVAILAELAR